MPSAPVPGEISHLHLPAFEYCDLQIPGSPIMRRIATREPSDGGNSRNYRYVCTPSSRSHATGKHGEASITVLLLGILISYGGAMALGYQLAVANGCTDMILLMLGVQGSAPMLKGLVSASGTDTRAWTQLDHLPNIKRTWSSAPRHLVQSHSSHGAMLSLCRNNTPIRCLSTHPVALPRSSAACWPARRSAASMGTHCPTPSAAALA